MNRIHAATPLPQVLAQPRLPLVRLNLEFTLLEDAVFPGYTGSIWRGRFGARLRKMACSTGAPDCEGCDFRQACQYNYIFATEPPQDAPRMRKYSNVPHPLVLAPPPAMGRKSYPAGSHFPLGVCLFGHACESAALVVHVLSLVGRDGPGRKGAPMRLGKISSPQLGAGLIETYAPGMEVPIRASSPSIPPCPRRPILVKLITPLRLVAEGRITGPERLEFGQFFSSLLRRISMLTVFHTDTPLETDFAGLVQLSKGLALQSRNLQWRELQRYSMRQNRRVPMGGVVGSFIVDLEEADAIWPYLWLGQWTHVGKGTIMGLGRYEIHGLPEDCSPTP